MKQKRSNKRKLTEIELLYVQTNKQTRLELDKLNIHAFKTNIQKVNMKFQN